MFVTILVALGCRQVCGGRYIAFPADYRATRVPSNVITYQIRVVFFSRLIFVLCTRRSNVRVEYTPRIKSILLEMLNIHTVPRSTDKWQ